MKRTPKWRPVLGEVAQYLGDNRSRRGQTVRVLAEASGERMIVEAIGEHGQPVHITVKTKNLGPVAPGLFD